LTPSATWLILNGVLELPYALGQINLARALQGASASPVQVESFPRFGTLAGQTQGDIRSLITQLEEQGLLGRVKKGDYRVLQVTAEGRAWLADHPELPESVPPASEPDQLAGDEALFDQLRSWRLSKAKELQYAPYVIFHDTILRRIAAAHPVSLDDLAAIKGIGPRKLEQYGADVLSVVAASRSNPAGTQSG